MGIDYVGLVQVDPRRLGAAGRLGPLGAAVEGCPGWDVERLVGHLGRVHRWATAAALSGARPDQDSFEKAPRGPDVVAWYEAGIDPLVDALSKAVPGGWNFVGSANEDGSFWPRRQAVETAIHRWDGAAAVEGAEAAAPIDAALAVDGIDELLTLFAPSKITAPGPAGSLHLHCNDTDGEWTLRAGVDGFAMERGHAKGDAALRGPASSLLLALWRRLKPGQAGTEAFGDSAVVDAWLAVL